MVVVEVKERQLHLGQEEEEEEEEAVETMIEIL